MSRLDLSSPLPRASVQTWLIYAVLMLELVDLASERWPRAATVTPSECAGLCSPLLVAAYAADRCECFGQGDPPEQVP